MDPNSEYRLVNDVVVSYNPQHQRPSEEALNRALQCYRDSFFSYYPRYKEQLGNLSFSQSIAVEAPHLPETWEEASELYEEFSWKNKDAGEDWIQGYRDQHFIFRGIKDYSQSRLVEYRNTIRDFDGNINEHIPLTPNLRQEYHDMVGGLEPPIPKFMTKEMEGVDILMDEDPGKSFWPPRAIDNRYHLLKSGFSFEESVTAGSPFETLNRVSNGLGLTPLVEQDLDKMMITERRQVDIKNTLRENYTCHQLISPGTGPGFGHGGSVSLAGGIFPNPFVIALLAFFYIWNFVLRFWRGKQKVTGESFPPHLIALTLED